MTQGIYQVEKHLMATWREINEKLDPYVKNPLIIGAIRIALLIGSAGLLFVSEGLQPPFPLAGLVEVFPSLFRYWFVIASITLLLWGIWMRSEKFWFISYVAVGGALLGRMVALMQQYLDPIRTMVDQQTALVGFGSWLFGFIMFVMVYPVMAVLAGSLGRQSDDEDLPPPRLY